ncbi:platelet-derived growth factor receptor alpha-like [Augochlora pura]
MEKPEYATSEVYDIMCQCWEVQPSLRPNFTQLADSVGNLLEGNVKAHYIELNAPYMDMNRTRLEGGMNDYLAMVSAPDHVPLPPPAQSRKNYTPSETTAEVGYLSMSPIDTVELSPMLKREEAEPYLERINMHERRAKLGRNRRTLDRSYNNSNRTTWS